MAEAKRKFYNIYSNNETFVARDGSMVVVKEGVFIYDPSEHSDEVAKFAQNMVNRAGWKEISEDESQTIRAKFAVGDPLSKLRAELLEQAKSEIMAQMSQKGVAVSDVVRNPSAEGVDNTALAILAAQQAAASKK